MANTSGSSTSFFRIPGNVKMQMLPFVLNPEKKSTVEKNTENDKQSVETSQNIKITSNIRSSVDFAGKTVHAQIFSFKNVYKHYNNCDAKAQINFLPSTINRLNNDISFKMLYDKNNNLPNITVDTILDNIPAIQIREFLPDTFLDQMLNFMTGLVNHFLNKGEPEDTESANPDSSTSTMGILEKIKSLFSSDNWQKILAVFNGLMGYLQGDVTVNGNTLVEVLASEGSPLLNQKGEDGTFITLNSINGNDRKLSTSIKSLPFLLYNCLQSTTTTNIYEIPGSPDGQLAYSSEGTEGWSPRDMRLEKLLKLDNGPTKGLLNKLGGGFVSKLIENVSIHYQPIWGSEKGSATRAPQISIKFNLINDTAQAALINFIFVNTIIPNNKWIQYGFFQQSPNLYDIKIEGYNRFFICSMKAVVKNLGIIREPTHDWIRTLVYNHFNEANMETTNEQFMNYIIDNKLIKIPDAYHVELTFDSLLPDNYNTFLFNYYNNTLITNSYDKVYQKSVMENFVTTGLAATGAVIKHFWNNPDDQNNIEKNLDIQANLNNQK